MTDNGDVMERLSPPLFLSNRPFSFIREKNCISQTFCDSLRCNWNLIYINYESFELTTYPFPQSPTSITHELRIWALAKLNIPVFPCFVRCHYGRFRPHLPGDWGLGWCEKNNNNTPYILISGQSVYASSKLTWFI